MEKEFISNRFARIRLAKNISARALSLELGQSTQYINQIESGRKMPSINGLLNFCDHFNISPKEFFDDEKEYPIEYKDLLPYLNKLDTDELDEITAIIKRIVQNKNIDYHQKHN